MPLAFLQTDGAGPTPFPARRIFRTGAVRRYIQNHQKTVVPRLICPRTFLCLWILLGLLCLAGTLAASHLLPLWAGQSRGVFR